MQLEGLDFQDKEALAGIGTTYAGSAFAPDCRFLAVGSTNGTVSVWDLTRHVLRREIKPGDGSVFPLSFLAQGNRLAVWLRSDNRCAEWDLQANPEVQPWPAPPHFDAFGVSPDERLGIGVGWNSDVSGRNLREHANENLPVDVLEGENVAFSPDGQHLAVASALGFARVWRTDTWREEATLGGFLTGVFSVAFSPDGKRLAIGASRANDTVRVCHVESWQALLTLEGTGSQFVSIAFSPDGDALGTLSRDGSLHIWQAPSWAEIHAAEAKERSEALTNRSKAAGASPDKG
jgi:WD40 repeat protein